MSMGMSNEFLIDVFNNVQLQNDEIKETIEALNDTVAAQKKTQKILTLDPKNRDSLVANFFSNTRSLKVTLYFSIYVKRFSCLLSGLKLLGKEQNDFT